MLILDDEEEKHWPIGMQEVMNKRMLRLWNIGESKKLNLSGSQSPTSADSAEDRSFLLVQPGPARKIATLTSACFRLKNSIKSSQPRYRPTMLGKNEKWLSLDRRRQGNQSTSKAELIMSDRKRCLLPSCISASAYLHILSIKIADARRALRARSVVRWW